jgi:DNA relaxase NicK
MITLPVLPVLGHACSSAPIGNTGVDSQPGLSVGLDLTPQIDYLSLVWRSFEHEKIVDRIDRQYNCMFDYERVRQRTALGGGDEFIIQGDGCCLSWRLGGSEECYRTWYKFELTGLGCSRLGSDGVSRLAGWFCGTLDAHCTRIDVQVSDYRRALSPSLLRTAIALGQFAGFKNHQYTESVKGKFHGWTFYLGSRSADKFVRIYDKYAQSSGVSDCIRYEVEYKSIAANDLFMRYVSCDSYAKKQQLLADCLAGSVQFLDRKDKNLQRAETLDWWQDFIDRISSSPTKVSPIISPTTIPAKLDWVCRNVAKALAILHESMGFNAVQDIIHRATVKAKAKISTIEREQIKMYRDTSNNYGF